MSSTGREQANDDEIPGTYPSDDSRRSNDDGRASQYDEGELPSVHE